MGRFSSQDKHMTIVIYVWLISYGMIYDTVEPSLSSRPLFFVPANWKKPYIDSCLKPLYNGTSLQRPRWSL